LQRQIWAYSDLDTVPEQIFVVAARTGGQVLCAYHGDRAVGFALGFAALRGGLTYLHSHMVAVLPEYQNQGVGRSLKLAQREVALAHGLDLIEWTFDPLQLKNAYFNIARLGAIVCRYIPNLYGRTSSPLHGGLPTDRLVAEWRLRSRRVEQALLGRPCLAGATCERISVPTTIREICRNDPGRAEEIQTNLRKQFEALIREDRAVVGFELQANQGTYFFEYWEN
jgi:predicted GNAT superfamily acetyltransferase